jgi:hypothetical protein
VARRTRRANYDFVKVPKSFSYTTLALHRLVRHRRGTTAVVSPAPPAPAPLPDIPRPRRSSLFCNLQPKLDSSRAARARFRPNPAGFTAGAARSINPAPYHPSHNLLARLHALPRQPDTSLPCSCAPAPDARGGRRRAVERGALVGGAPAGQPPSHVLGVACRPSCTMSCKRRAAEEEEKRKGRREKNKEEEKRVTHLHVGLMCPFCLVLGCYYRNATKTQFG